MNNPQRRAAILLTGLTLAGCATPGGGPDVQARFAAAQATCKPTYADPRLDPIRSKSALLSGIPRPTLEMLSDPTKPDEAQKAAILVFDRIILNCATEYAQVYALLGSDYVALFSRGVSNAQAARLDLYEGRLTFGEYVRRLDSLQQDQRAAMAALDQQRQQAAIQRMGAAAAMMSAMPQPIPYQPITIKPIQAPTNFNCISNKVGAYVYTNCN